MIPPPLCADSQFVSKYEAVPATIYFAYEPNNVRLNTTLQVSGTNDTYIGKLGDTPAFINLYGLSISGFDKPPGTPAVLKVVAMRKPGCTDDCMLLSTLHMGTENVPIIVSDMLEAGSNASATVTWADVQPSEELALFYKSLLAV